MLAIMLWMADRQMNFTIQEQDKNEMYNGYFDTSFYIQIKQGWPFCSDMFPLEKMKGQKFKLQVNKVTSLCSSTHKTKMCCGWCGCGATGERL